MFRSVYFSMEWPDLFGESNMLTYILTKISMFVGNIIRTNCFCNCYVPSSFTLDGSCIVYSQQLADWSSDKNRWFFLSWWLTNKKKIKRTDIFSTKFIYHTYDWNRNYIQTIIFRLIIYSLTVSLKCCLHCSHNSSDNVHINNSCTYKRLISRLKLWTQQLLSRVWRIKINLKKYNKDSKTKYRCNLKVYFSILK